jgi:hypothetical protein
MNKHNLPIEEYNEASAALSMLYASTAAQYGKKRGTNLTPKKKKRKKR